MTIIMLTWSGLHNPMDLIVAYYNYTKLVFFEFIYPPWRQENKCLADNNTTNYNNHKIDMPLKKMKTK